MLWYLKLQGFKINFMVGLILCSKTFDETCSQKAALLLFCAHHVPPQKTILCIKPVEDELESQILQLIDLVLNCTESIHFNKFDNE